MLNADMLSGDTVDEADLSARGITWNLESLLDGGGDPLELVEQAAAKASVLEAKRGTVASMDAGALAETMSEIAAIQTLLSRAGHYGMLRFCENTQNEQNAAMMQKIEEQSTAIASTLVFVDLEFGAIDDDRAEVLLSDPVLDFCRHHLENTRRSRKHMLSEAEEKVLIESSVSGASAWVRLFNELTATIEVELVEDGEPIKAGLEKALSLLSHPDRAIRKQSADAITVGLESGLKVRSYIYNTLLLDKSVGDRLRGYPSWVSSRNLANEASDESVQAIIEAVVSRYDIPRRWYGLKAKVLGLDRLEYYDRMAGVGDSQRQIGWSQARAIVCEAYGSFSSELASIVDRFFNESWIDAAVRDGKQPGAFCAYSVPEDHPYVMLNWTGSLRDVSTLAHELGHGVHGYLAREQGIFHQSTPLTLAETASVFGEAVTNNALLSMIDDPGERFALLAASMDDAVATVFRQVAMNRFEDACHSQRRSEGELSVDRFGQLWLETQNDMMGDSVDLADDYSSWWSYVHHFMAVPGYVYAYAYGQLLALSVYARYRDRGEEFVPFYLELLKAGGSRSPEDLGAIVDCDLADPGFWDAGLDIIDEQLGQAEEAGKAAGRI